MVESAYKLSAVMASAMKRNSHHTICTCNTDLTLWKYEHKNLCITQTMCWLSQRVNNWVTTSSWLVISTRRAAVTDMGDLEQLCSILTMFI